MAGTFKKKNDLSVEIELERKMSGIIENATIERSQSAANFGFGSTKDQMLSETLAKINARNEKRKQAHETDNGVELPPIKGAEQRDEVPQINEVVYTEDPLNAEDIQSINGPEKEKND